MPETSLEDLCAMDARGLADVMRAGHAIDPDALADREYDGVSLNLPDWITRLTWVKFKKVFHRDASGIRGWNCRAVQSPLDAPWELQKKDGEPITYGHYRVVSSAGYRMPRPYGAGLMLDYGLGGNPLLDATRFVRDPVVAVHAGSAELLLGWTYVDLGLARVGTPSFFALRRGVPLGHVVPPPRGA